MRAAAFAPLTTGTKKLVVGESYMISSTVFPEVLVPPVSAGVGLLPEVATFRVEEWADGALEPHAAKISASEVAPATRKAECRFRLEKRVTRVVDAPLVGPGAFVLDAEIVMW